MPYKTKRQKIQAQERRFIEGDQVKVTLEKEVAVGLEARNEARVQSQIWGSMTNYDFVRGDILKTSVVALLILLFQLLVKLRIS